jgi:hypothetical protein
MIPIRTSTIFKSRWWALLWAAGIMWLAVDVAGASKPEGNSASNESGSTDAAGAPVTDEDAEIIANALGLE